jgi:polar amino acid transport system substrate-binding protein
VRAAVAEWDGVIACDVGQRWDNRGLAGLDALFFIPLSYFCREFRTMKKLATVALVAAAALLAACTKQEPATPINAAPAPAAVAKIVVGLDDNFPPMGFRNEKNELVGFDIDMAREAAKRLGVEVEFKPIDWSAKEAELSGKRVDALWNGLTITEQRKQNILFTAPYMENHQIIVVSAGSPIKTKADLAGKVVGAQEGSSAVDAIKKEEAVFQSFKELKTFGDNVTALMDLSTGRLEAVVVDEVVGRYYVAKKPDQYAVLEDHFGTEEYGVGLRKDDTELHGKLEKALGEMKADGAAAKIAEQWFGKNIIK